MTISKRDLRRAAALLAQQAKSLWDTYHTGDGRWLGYSEYTGGQAKVEHDELVDLARKLDAHAKVVKA